MSDESDERPSFGGLGAGTRRSQGFSLGMGWGTPNNEEEGDADDGWQPRKRTKFDNDASQPKPASSVPQSRSGGKMTFAQRQMAKMGWKEGQGLGAEGKGRLNPIEVVQRPMGAGVGTVREKTKQAKEEEKRAAAFRGEVLEDSSEEERKRKKAAKEKRRAAQSGARDTAVPWTRKPKYVTVDELKADLQDTDVPRSLLEFAIDLSGNAVSSANQSFVPVQMPAANESEAEKVAKRLKREIISCAESRHGINEQKAALSDLEVHLVGNIDRYKTEIESASSMLQKISKLEDMQLEKSTDTVTAWEQTVSAIETLYLSSDEGVVPSELQEVAVAAIHPLLRLSLSSWDPLSNPKYLVEYFERLKNLFMVESQTNVATVYGAGDDELARPKRSKDFYFSMMHNLWLPRISSVIRNDFQVDHPNALLRLFKAWKPYLPSAIYSTIISSALIPRLVAAVKSWKPRPNKKQGSSPDAWVFPWLEFLPVHHIDPASANGLMSEVRRRLRHVLSAHPIQNGIPAYIIPWKDLLGSALTKILVSQLLPRLAAYLSQNFVIDPSNQDTAPLDTVLCYTSVFPTETMAHLLAVEFFPKFHAILYEWLVSSTVNYDEVTEWWTWWKAQIPTEIRDHPSLQPEWTRALNMIGRALDLGERAAAELTPPPTRGDGTGISSKSINGSLAGTATPKASLKTANPKATPQEAPRELTFKDIVADWCIEHDIFLLSTREAHTGTGEPLLRITASIDQRGGVLAYIRGDVLYVRGKKDRSVWTPTELGAELEKRASER